MTSAAAGPFLFEADAAAAAGNVEAARATYEAIAANGDPRAWVALGDLVASASEGEAEEAIACYRRGAESDDPIAALRLGDSLRADALGAGDTELALRWYDRAAELGLAAGAARAGHLLWDADPTHANAAEAEQRWLQAVSLDRDASALVGLARLEVFRGRPVAGVGHAIRAAMVARRRLVETDSGSFTYEQAESRPGVEETAHALQDAMDLVNEYRMETLEAAEAGDPDACWHWGRVEQLGFGQLADPEEGEAWIERAADAGHTDAVLALARRDRSNGDMESFERRLRTAAAAGSSSALHDLAYALYSGAFGQPPDVDGALEAYRSAAGPDEPTTATDLSFVLEDLPGDEAAEESVRWLRVAADAGNVAAMRRFGERYRDGDGVDADARLALRWFLSAYYAGWTDGLESLRTVAVGIDADEIVLMDREVGGSGEAAAQLLEPGNP